MQHQVGIVALVFLLGAPLVFGLVGLLRARAGPDARPPATPWDWKLTILSLLLYVLAFNLTFFLQELFLVVPKAFTPGLRPTLFHNNHQWAGAHPLASLFQGTGALAIFISGATCALLLGRGVSRSTTVRLFLLWMAYNGFFQSLPQVVVGAINPRNDVGMAMDFLHLSATSKAVAAFVALAVIPALALWLARQMPGLAASPEQIATAGARTRFVFLIATLPALLAIPLIIVFRVPRELIEVVAPPIAVAVVGIAWMQAGAWLIGKAPAGGSTRVDSLAYPLGAVLVLLFLFQVVLRPGVPFH